MEVSLVRESINIPRMFVAIIFIITLFLFVYWKFCRKNELSSNKIRGGGPNFINVEINGHIYRVIGKQIWFLTPLLVLSSKGESVLRDLNDVMEEFYVYFERYIRGVGIDKEKNEFNIVRVMQEPCTYFGLEDGRSKKTAPVLLGSKNMEELMKFNNVFCFGAILDKFKTKNGEVDMKRCEKLKEVANKYKELRQFVNKYANEYFDEASFIGQPSVYKLPDSTPHFTLNCTRFSTVSENIMSGNSLFNACNAVVREWYSSEKVKGAMKTGYYLNKDTGDISQIETQSCSPIELAKFDFPIEKVGTLDCGLGEDAVDENPAVDEDEKIEEEKHVGTAMTLRKREAKSYADMDEEESEREKRKETKKHGRNGTQEVRKGEWQVADIYPANKVITSTLFLLGLTEFYIKKKIDEGSEKEYVEIKRDYFKMMSSYMIFIHLVNLCCSVKMTSRWNIKISNSYVYQYSKKNINGLNKGSTTLTEMFMEKRIAEETGVQTALMTMRYQKNNDVMNGLVRTLGRKGVSDIFLRYTKKFLDTNFMDTLIKNKDALLWFIRKYRLLRVEDLRLLKLRLKKKIENNEEPVFLSSLIDDLILDKTNIEKKSSSSEDSEDESRSENGIVDEDDVIIISPSTAEDLNNLKELQLATSEWLDTPNDLEENFQNLWKKIEDMRICDSEWELRDYLAFVNNLALYHSRCEWLFDKIEKLLDNFDSSIKKFFNDFDLFKIFSKNNIILVYLLNNRKIVFDEVMLACLNPDDTALVYLYPFLKDMLDESDVKDIKGVVNDAQYVEKRKCHENDSVICQLIRDDAINDFLLYVEKSGIGLDSTIPNSYFETDKMLKNRDITLIQYTAFQGSVNIFKYLAQRVPGIDFCTYKFAIHGGNSEIISIIGEKVQIENKEEYEELLWTSLRCYRHNFFLYFFNLMGEGKFEPDESLVQQKCFEYRNFISCDFGKDVKITTKILAKYDSYPLVEKIYKKKNMNGSKIWEKVLRYSSFYLVVKVNEITRIECVFKDDTEIETLKGMLKDGKDANDLEMKKKFFSYVFNFGINTKSRYQMLLGDDVKIEDNDEFLRFIDNPDGFYVMVRAKTVEEIVEETKEKGDNVKCFIKLARKFTGAESEDIITMYALGIKYPEVPFERLQEFLEIYNEKKVLGEGQLEILISLGNYFKKMTYSKLLEEMEKNSGSTRDELIKIIEPKTSRIKCEIA